MRIISYSLLLSLLACNESVIEKQDNTAPTILIGSHSPDAEILEGYIESFRATVSDDDNEFSELTVAWYVGDEIVCDWASVSPAGGLRVIGAGQGRTAAVGPSRMSSMNSAENRWNGAVNHRLDCNSGMQ